MLGPISTDRLLLRPVRLEDAVEYHALETDSAVKQFLGRPSTHTVEYYQRAIQSGAPALRLTLAVTEKIGGAFLGRCGFTGYTESQETLGWEMNIVLRRQYWRHGYGTEVGFALLPRGFAVLGCEKILGVADAANEKSLSLCSRLGMHFERTTTRYGRPAHIYSVERNA